MAVTSGRIFAINLLANSKPAEDAFKRVGQAAGRIPTPLKVAAGAITAVFAAVTAVAVKSFRDLLQLGEEFNEVTRIISVGTGAVGGDLAALEQSFRDVARTVPNSFADVATVIAELDTRTDLAGDGLEAMAEQMLTLARLTGGDVRTTTREVTRLFNRFGLSAEDASDMLDLLFRASQASGAEVDRLAEDVTKNAGALGAMGLSLEESVALIALFEREGVRTRTVVSALQTGFLKLTRDGALPLNEALATTFEELQTLDREAAIAKGLEIFGTSALELVDAVRDGRLSVEDFTRQIADGESTILGVADETDGWRVKLDELKNFLKLKFEGPATAVFDGLTEVIEGLIPAAERVEEAYSVRGLAGALEQVKIEWNRIYENNIKPIW
ncbi:MAG TPA: phage tail tape measure protein, partial [Acidimicrobiia bacterium]